MGGEPSPPGFRDGSAEQLGGTPLESLAPFIGDWEVETTWSNGTALWARNEYRVMLGGAYIDVLTWARDGEGDPYLRYYSVYRWDTEQEKIVATGFQSDGTSESLVMEPGGDAGGFRTEWGEYPMRIRQSIGVPEDGRYAWKVWMLAGAEAEPAELISAEWVKTDNSEQEQPMTGSKNGPPAGPYAIDPGLFAEADARSITCETAIGAPASRLFGLLSTEAGMREVYGIESRIDLAVGGPYEWYFQGDEAYGTKGGEGNQILSWIPDRMLAFSWNAPPTQPESRALRTRVVVEFDENDAGSTDVTITHMGFGDAAHWAETEAYFKAAWPRVLAALKAAAEG